MVNEHLFWLLHIFFLKLFQWVGSHILLLLNAMIGFQVVGIEMNASAVADAQRNAEINAITNCKFICSKVRS